MQERNNPNEDTKPGNLDSCGKRRVRGTAVVPLRQLVEHQSVLGQWLSVCKRAKTNRGSQKPNLRGLLLLCMGGIALSLFGLGSSLAAQPTNSVSRNDYSSFKLINERNIFNSRRSPRYVPSERRESRRVRSESFALVGVMKYEKGLFAFFDGTRSDYRKVLKQEDTIAGYKITSIEPSRVKLASATNEVELSLGKQLRREDEGEWRLSDRPEVLEPSTYASSSRSYRSGGSSVSNNASIPGDGGDFSGDPTAAPVALPFGPGGPDIQFGADVGPDTVVTNIQSAPITTGGGTDTESVLERLRRRREQQEGQ